MQRVAARAVRRALRARLRGKVLHAPGTGVGPLLSALSLSTKETSRAAFKKKHGVSECQEALEMWEDKERWDARQLNYDARLCRL